MIYARCYAYFLQNSTYFRETVTYFFEDRIVALVFFKGKFAKGNEHDIGFSFKTKPDIPGFIDALI